jgi:branched-chain amino acid transport system substrate-binding protein
LPEFTATLQGDAEGICGHVWWTKDLAWKGAVFADSREYARLFETEYGSVPTYHAAAGSASGLILQLAIEAAGTIETEAVRAQLESMDVETFFGPIKFNEYNMSANGIAYPVQVQSGKAVLLYPPNVKQMEIIFPMLPWDQK